MGICKPMVILYSPTPIEEYLQKLEDEQKEYFKHLFQENQNNELSQLALQFLYNKIILDFCYTYDQQNQKEYLETLRISITHDLLNFKNCLCKSNEFWMSFLQSQAFDIIIQMYDHPLKKIKIVEQTEPDIVNNQIRIAQTFIQSFRSDTYYFFINFNNDLKKKIASFYW